MEKSILVVDDSPDLLELLQLMLREAGFHVHAEDSAPKAISYLEQARPDLILLDVQMPEMTGPELLDRLVKSHHPALDRAKVVFSSAGRPPKDKQAQGFIDKMTDLESYVQAIRSVLGAPTASLA